MLNSKLLVPKNCFSRPLVLAVLLVFIRSRLSTVKDIFNLLKDKDKPISGLADKKVKLIVPYIITDEHLSLVFQLYLQGTHRCAKSRLFPIFNPI